MQEKQERKHNTNMPGLTTGRNDCQNNNEFRCSGYLRNSVAESLALQKRGHAAIAASLRFRTARVNKRYRSSARRPLYSWLSETSSKETPANAAIAACPHVSKGSFAILPVS